MVDGARDRWNNASMPGIQNAEVGAVFAAAPPRVRRRLLELRSLIRATAQETEGVGPLEESLRWGQPAYLTSQTGSGTTVRLGWKPSMPDQISVLVHCQTSLVSELRPTLSPALRFDGNRGVLLALTEPVPQGPLRLFVEAALTYHLRKRTGTR